MPPNPRVSDEKFSISDVATTENANVIRKKYAPLFGAKGSRSRPMRARR